ncbi:hypothetical protein [Microbacterium esteraromaticum]|uniref:hypothetical protein n=1 Tax=Microbacterium esteraromaticum TaxID=57043 RepID=UPI000B34AFF3|nr:hypothetical protein [Microbacterium esteraromaticum]
MMTARARTGAAIAAAGLMLGMLSACTPEPEPTPTKTALFTSEEEAFAVAEETYRAYTTAISDVDLEDATTFSPVFAWLTGDAEASERKTLSELSAQGLTITGSTSHVAFTPADYTAATGSVVARLCIDVSDVDLVGSDGASVVPIDRPELQPVEVMFAPAPTTTGLAIASSDESPEYACDTD